MKKTINRIFWRTHGGFTMTLVNDEPHKKNAKDDSSSCLSALFDFFSSPKLTLVLACVVPLFVWNLRLSATVSPSFLSHHDGLPEDLPWRNLPRSNSNVLHNNNNFSDDRDGSFSACLLIMDDNHRLPEWLAYHWFTTNLRYLVVAVDPASQTSPAFIWSAWRTYMNMTIEQWTDSDFTNRNLRRPIIGGGGASEKLLHGLHRARQWMFYNACTRHLKAKNQTWTLYMDTDEYISINQDVIPDATRRIRQANSIPRLLHQLRNDVNGTMSAQQSYFYQQNRTCYTIPRRLYSAVESSATDIAQQVPTGFDPMRLDTLRYRYRAADNATQRNGFCKSIINVAAVPDKLLGWNMITGTAHRPIRRLCPSQFVEYVFPIGIHHYLGSLEAFTARNDARKNNFKSATMWHKYAHRRGAGLDDEIRPWLSGFVDLVGQEMASFLLQRAGVVG